MKSLTAMAEEIQEMCENGASISDLVSILEPYYKAREIELSWKNNPDRMGGQFTSEELYEAEKHW